MAETQEQSKEEIPSWMMTAGEPAVPARSAPPPSSRVDDLFGGVGLDMEGARTGLMDLYGKKAAAERSISGQTIGRAEQDRTIAKQHFDAAGYEKEKLQPWNAKEEYEKTQHSPLEAFGSFASAFGIIASAFTHAPMQNALNASAAAMNAIHENDDKTYERAHGAWKENMALVEKRFAMEQALYGDALKLMSTDMTLGEAKMKAAAMQFGDQKTIMMLEHGMLPELNDALTSRVKTMEGMRAAADKMDESAFRRVSFERMQAEDAQMREWAGLPPPTAEETTRMYLKAHGVKEAATERTALDYITKPNPDGTPKTPEQASRFLQNLRQGSRSGDAASYKEAFDTFKEEIFARENRAPTSDEINAFHKKWAQNSSKRQMSQKEEGIQQIIDASRDANGNPTKTIAQASGEFADAQLRRSYTDTQTRQIKAVPVLMDHLRTLDYFAHVTGPVQGVPAEIAAIYGGLNDPAMVFELAKRGARQAATEWGGSGKLKSQVETMLDTIPKTYQNWRANKAVAQQTMRDVSNEAQTLVSLLEKSGKPLPESTMEKYVEQGIYPESIKNKNPVLLLRNDPTSVPDSDLQAMRRYKNSLPLNDQKLIDQEVIRRAKLWEQSRGR